MSEDQKEKKQDRSVTIGHATNVQVNSGDSAEINTVFQGQQQNISSQDFVKALKELNDILSKAQLDTSSKQVITEAITTAETEAVKEKPEKGKIAQALEKAVTLAKFANNAKELIVLATPLIPKIVGWLGNVGNKIADLLK